MGSLLRRIRRVWFVRGMGRGGEWQAELIGGRLLRCSHGPAGMDGVSGLGVHYHMESSDDKELCSLLEPDPRRRRSSKDLHERSAFHGPVMQPVMPAPYDTRLDRRASQMLSVRAIGRIVVSFTAHQSSPSSDHNDQSRRSPLSHPSEKSDHRCCISLVPYVHKLHPSVGRTLMNPISVLFSRKH